MVGESGSYRLIDDAAGSEPPSIQEATCGNREADQGSDDTLNRGPGLDRGEAISSDEKDEGKAQSNCRDAKRLEAQKHRPQYGTAR